MVTSDNDLKNLFGDSDDEVVKDDILCPNKSIALEFIVFVTLHCISYIIRNKFSFSLIFLY